MSRHFENVTIGTKLFATYLWDVARKIPVNMPVFVFYWAMTPLLVFLKFESEQSFGLTVFEEVTGLPWTWLVLIFGLCGLITAYERNPVVNVVATLPMLFYAILLIHGVVSRSVSTLGLTGLVYLLVASLAIMGTIRYYTDLELANKRINENDQKITQLEKVIRSRGPDHR